MAGMDLTVRALREQVAAAIDLVVHVARLQDGVRRVTSVTEVVGMEGDTVTMQDLFVFHVEGGIDERGRVRGRLASTGLRPHFLEHLAERNVQLDPLVVRAWPGDGAVVNRRSSALARLACLTLLAVAAIPAHDAVAAWASRSATWTSRSSRRSD